MLGPIFFEISIIVTLNRKSFMTVFHTMKVAKTIFVPNSQ